LTARDPCGDNQRRGRCELEVSGLSS
jgi:hypothetical protein